MTKTQKNWLISLLAITLVGGATVGLVLPLTMCSVNPTPGPTPPPGPINNDLKLIGNYNESATADLEHPIVYINKDKNKDDANVLRFMEIQAGSNLETTYGCSGWTVFGTKIETIFWSSSCFDTDINVDTIPETVLIGGAEKKIKNIGRFSSDNITSLIIPDFIEVIGKDAFNNCTGLTGPLTIPASATTIGDDAFSGCSGLTSLDLSQVTKLKTIGDQAFVGCTDLTGPLTIPASVTSIDNGAFYECSFTSIEVNPLNQKYALASSKSVGAASVVIDKEQYPDLNYDYTTNPVGGLACGELTVWNDPNLIVLDSVFYATGITKVIIGDNITEILSSFRRCHNLTTLDLSNASNLAIIGISPNNNDTSFVDCPKLTGELIIPAKLKQIPEGNPFNPTFNNSAFKKLIFKGSPSSNIKYATIFKATIDQISDKYEIHVPLADRDAYIAKFPSVPSENIKGV